MKDLRLLELAQLVVAWHNRHPLARRIGPEHVHSMGYVVVPFLGPIAPPTASASGAAAPSGGSLRERAMARARQAQDDPAAAASLVAALQPTPPRDLRRAFTEDFLPPLSPRAIGRWAARHGVTPSRLPHDAPVRRVLAEAGSDPARLVERWLLTAQIDGGRHRTRVLVSGGVQPAVMGRRLFSMPRLAAMAGVVLVVAAGLAQVLQHEPTAAPAIAAVSLPASAVLHSAAPAPAPASAATSAPAATDSVADRLPVLTYATAPPLAVPLRTASAAVAAPPASAPTATAAAAPEPVVGQPIDVEPTLGRVELPSLGPRVEARRRAAEEARLAAAAAAASAATPAATATATASTAMATPGTIVIPAGTPLTEAPRNASATPMPPARPVEMKGAAFALSTRLLRTRTESDQLATAMRALLVPPGAQDMHVDVMPAGDDWRVVGWPYADRAAALRAQALLAARGLKVQVIDF